MDALKNARHSHTATLLPSGKVLVTGGNSAKSGYLDSAEIYDPDSKEWIPVRQMPLPRDKHTATLLPSGKVLITGGERHDGVQAVPLNSTEVYDPVSNTWTTEEELVTARFSHTAILLPSLKLLVMGGNSQSGEKKNAIADAQVFDAMPPPESHYGSGCTTTPTLPASGVWLGLILWHRIAASRARRAARVRE